MIRFALIAALACAFCTTSAQSLLIGNSVGYLSPHDDLGEFYKFGYSFNANAEVNLMGPLSLSAEFGYGRWFGVELDGAPQHKANSFDLMAGLRLNLLGPLYVEGRTGYYFGDFDKYAIITAGGLRFGRLDFNAGFQFIDEMRFVNFRLGYYWARTK